MSSLPEVYEVMRRIESCQREDYRMYLKALFEFCARGIECAGELTSTDKCRRTIPYGPKGKDCWLAESEAPDIPAKDILSLTLNHRKDKNKPHRLSQKKRRLLNGA